MENLGDGHTSVVYLAKDLRTNQKVAIKMIRSNYVSGDSRAVNSIKDEVQVMKLLDHQNCVRLLKEGSNGSVVKASGRKIEDITYIMMEHVKGGTLFDFQEMLNEGQGMGESYGRFIMHQLLNAVEYIHSKSMAHRDIKPENIIIDDNMQVKLLDFGFATTRNIHKLVDYRGTQSYMAPEIKKG